MRRLAALLLVLGTACTGGEREGLTADSAVMQTPAGPGDTGGSTVGIGVGVDSSGDSLTVDSIALHNPMIVLVTDSVAGDELFRRKGKCLSCHGLAGKGLDALGPNLQDSVWLHGDGSFAFIRRTIMDGIARPKVSSNVMPALSTTLSPEEIYRVAAYVFTLSHPGSALTDTTTFTDTIPSLTDTLVPPPVTPPPADAASSDMARAASHDARTHPATHITRR